MENIYRIFQAWCFAFFVSGFIILTWFIRKKKLMNANNVEIHFDFEQQFNNDNKYRYYSGIDDFHCVACGKSTTVDGSYSNKGDRLICKGCVEKMAKEMNLTPVDLLKKYIWRNSEHET